VSATDPGEGRLPLLTLVGVCVALGLLYLWRTPVVFEDERVFLLWDDAMISMQYAKNLAEGNGLVWSAGGERVQGISNLGVTLVMAALHLLPLGPGRHALLFQLLNLAAMAASVGLVYRLHRDHLPGGRAAALVAAAGVAFCFPLLVYAVQGADTAFVALWLLLCHAWLARGTARGESWPAGLFTLLALGAVLRPDSALFLAPFGLVSLARTGLASRATLEAIAAAAAVGGGLLLFGWLYYGDPLPNTYYLKATGQPRGLMLAHGWLQLRWWALHWALLLPLVVAGAWQQRALPVVRAAAGCIAVAFAYHVWVGGDIQANYGSRFLLPVLPLMAILATAGAWGLCQRLVPGRARRAVFVLVTLAAFAVGNAWKPTREILGTGPDTMLKRYNEQNLASALFFRSYTRPRTTLALHWAGLISYYSDRPVVDVLGKSDRHIARLHVDRFAPGHSKWDWDYVIETLEPDILNDVSRGLLERPDFRERYVRAEPPGFPSFYIRKDRIRKLRYEGTHLYGL